MRRQLETLVPSPFIRFLISGGIAAGVNIVSRLILSQFFPYDVAIVVAYLIGMTTAYLLMLVFVFEASGHSVSHKYLRFGLVNVAALAQVWLISIAFARWIFPAIGFDWHALTVAHAVGVISPVLTSYVGHKYFTFAPEPGRATRVPARQHAENRTLV
jgi:putative flippase GtrA